MYTLIYGNSVAGRDHVIADFTVSTPSPRYDENYSNVPTVAADEATVIQSSGSKFFHGGTPGADEDIYGIMVGRQGSTCLAYIPFTDPYTMTSGDAFNVQYNLRFRMKGLQPV